MKPPLSESFRKNPTSNQEYGAASNSRTYSGLSFESLAESNLHCLGLLEFSPGPEGGPDFLIRYANRKLAKLLQQPGDQLAGKFLSEIYPFSDNWLQCRVYFDVLDKDAPVTEEFPMEIYGDTRWYRHEIVPFDTKRLLITAEDITSRKQMEKALISKVFNDELTGLKNRRSLIEHLNCESEFDINHALVLLDVDNFRGLCECYGLQRSDDLLRQIAQRLKAIDSGLCYRISADIFALLYSWRDQEVGLSETQISRWLTALQLGYNLDESTINCSFSSGYAERRSSDKSSASRVLSKAEVALASAKQRKPKRQIVPYSGAVMKRHQQRRLISSALPEALRGNEFSTFYQPQYSFEDGSLKGCEALCRWQNPDLGQVSPEIFIDIAEQMYLLHELDLMQLENMVRFVGSIGESDQSLSMSVNASPSNIQNPEYIDRLISIAKDLPSNYQLEVEITENVLISDDQSLGYGMNRLAKAGIGLCLDDFGSGYSNLSYLSQYPFEKLKLDKSLISNLEANFRNELLVSATIDLAHSLGLTVVAEGVETSYQSKWLKDVGCDLAQGYFFSRPLNESSSRALCLRHRHFA